MINKRVTAQLIFIFFLISFFAGHARAEQSKSLEAFQKGAQQIWRNVKSFFYQTQRESKKITNKFVNKMSTPLDRSKVNAKADSLARAMDEASKASTALHKKNLAINAEIGRRSKGFGESFQDESEKRGRFSSLD